MFSNTPMLPLQSGNVKIPVLQLLHFAPIMQSEMFQKSMALSHIYNFSARNKIKDLLSQSGKFPNVNDLHLAHLLPSIFVLQLHTPFSLHSVEVDPLISQAQSKARLGFQQIQTYVYECMHKYYTLFTVWEPIESSVALSLRWSRYYIRHYTRYYSRHSPRSSQANNDS